MKVFSRQGLALSLLQIVVWDRSDIFFLKNLQPDIRQVAFFSVAFNVTDKLLLLPRSFGSAVGSTMMARAGRDPGTMASLLAVSTRYTLLAAMPILLGTAALSGPLTRLLYGAQYIPLVPVLAIAAVFGISKALMVPAQLMLQATERQGFLVKWTALCGLVNVALDIWLIPRYGAVGAMAANGSAQTLATVGFWFHICRVSGVSMRVGPLGRIAAAALGMAAAVLLLSAVTPPAVAMISGVAVGAALFVVLVRITGALASPDRDRLLRLSPLAPRPLRPVLGRLADILSPVV